jgi:hypothetical protein
MAVSSVFPQRGGAKYFYDYMPGYNYELQAERGQDGSVPIRP